MALGDIIKKQRDTIVDPFAATDSPSPNINNQVKAPDPFSIQPTQSAAKVDQPTALERAIERTERVAAGDDPFTQQIIARQEAGAGAREAAARASQRQQMEQAGFDEAFQSSAAQQQARDFESQRAERAGEMAEFVGRRQDAATERLVQLEQTQLGREELQRQNDIESFQQSLSGFDVTQGDPAQLLAEGKRIYGENYTLDSMLNDKWKSQLDQTSTAGVNQLLTKFGPQSGNTIFQDFMGQKTDIIDPNKIDPETKTALSDWYTAYTKGEGELFETDGELSPEGYSWLKNKMTEVEMTEAEKLMNENLAELSVLYGDDPDKLALVQESARDYMDYIVSGRDLDFAGGALEDDIMVDSITGELIGVDEDKYKTGGRDDEIGYYGITDDEKLVTEDGQEFSVKDGIVQLNGNDYTGDDADKIKQLISGKTEADITAEEFEVPEGIKTGTVYQTDDGELMVNDGGTPVAIDVLSPTLSDFKALKGTPIEDFNKMDPNTIVSMIENYSGEQPIPNEFVDMAMGALHPIYKHTLYDQGVIGDISRNFVETGVEKGKWYKTGEGEWVKATESGGRAKDGGNSVFVVMEFQDGTKQKIEYRNGKGKGDYKIGWFGERK